MTGKPEGWTPVPEEQGGWPLRAPCRYCGHRLGTMRPKGGQNCVYCDQCGRLAYNAPKVETGQQIRSIRTRPDIKPSQRARVLERDNHACIGCGRHDQLLHIGHLISVDEGHTVGMTDTDLYDDENLAAMCEECNIGQGRRSLNPRLVWRLWRLERLHKERRPAHDAAPALDLNLTSSDAGRPFE